MFTFLVEMFGGSTSLIVQVVVALVHPSSRFEFVRRANILFPTLFARDAVDDVSRPATHCTSDSVDVSSCGASDRRGRIDEVITDITVHTVVVDKFVLMFGRWETGGR